MRLKGYAATEYRYNTIIRLRESGMRQKDIAEQTGCSQCWVSDVLKRYKSLGTERMGIKGKAPGNACKLSDASIEMLKSFLMEGSLAHGFETDNWTRERIAQLIKTKFNVDYHVSHMSKLMKRMGFSSQKPVHHSYRKDESAVDKWKSEELPALKKS
jgi:transposase